MINFISKGNSTTSNVNEESSNNKVKVVKRVESKTDDKKNGKYDMIGRVFGDFTVVEQDGVDGTHHKLWKCVCNKCGETFKTTSYELTRGRKNTNCTKNNVDNNGIVCDNDGDSAFINEDSTYTTASTSNNVNTQIRAVPFDTIDPENFVVSTDDCHLIYHREVCYDLFNVPFYYSVAYCLPTNFSTYGATASKLGVVCNESIKWMKYEVDCFNEEREIGTIAQNKNLFILCVNEERKIPEKENIKKCICELAEYCAYGLVEYLAMPRICCGHNHQDWEEIKTLIIDTFVEVYTDIKDNDKQYFYDVTGKSEPTPINITFCYQ